MDDSPCTPYSRYFVSLQEQAKFTMLQLSSDSRKQKGKAFRVWMVLLVLIISFISIKISTQVSSPTENEEDQAALDRPVIISKDRHNSTAEQQDGSNAAPPAKVVVNKVHPVSEIVEFEKQDSVVIATKLHGPHQQKLLMQSLCLLTYAYNNRLSYDILVFTAEPLEPDFVTNLRKTVYPANLTIAIDNDGLQQEIVKLSPIRYTKFLQRCKVDSPENLTWFSNCPGRIAYNWQAEFRTLHIWNHPAILPYRTMMWLDTDGFCAKLWDRDPIAFFLKNDLVMLFDNFPQGRAKKTIAERVVQSFNTSLCEVRLKNGHLAPDMGRPCPGARFHLIHGFFHVTNLDFYRTPQAKQWFETLIGDCFLCRDFDDQVAVTALPAILAPNRSWDMRYHGLRMDVYHNGQRDGKEKAGGFRTLWKQFGASNFSQAYPYCTINNGG